MRRRVFTKSPVRENCTPGSVRGLLGNWQSYRDPVGVVKRGILLLVTAKEVNDGFRCRLVQEAASCLERVGNQKFRSRTSTFWTAKTTRMVSGLRSIEAGTKAASRRRAA